jgi:hypothetical protein
MQDRNSSELVAWFATALKFCTLKRTPPNKKQQPAAAESGQVQICLPARRAGWVSVNAANRTAAETQWAELEVTQPPGCCCCTAAPKAAAIHGAPPAALLCPATVGGQECK